MRPKLNGSGALWEQTEQSVSRVLSRQQASHVRGLADSHRAKIPEELSDPATPIVVFDESGALQSLNKPAGDILRIGTLLGHENLSEWVEPDDAPLFLQHLRLCRTLPELPVLSFLRLNIQGLVLSVELVSICAESEIGPRFRTAILQGSTDFSTETARLSERILRSLDLAVALAKPDGRICWVNAAFLRLFHVNAHYAVGLSVLDMVQSPGKGGFLQERFARVLAGRRYVESALLDCHPTHVRHPTSIVLTIRRLPTERENQSLLLLQFQNVTARIRAEAEREAVLRELQELSESLELKVSERTFELQEAHERLRQSSSALVELQERERRHLACELHDEVGQNLTGLKMMLAELLRGAPPNQQSALTEAHRTAARALEQIRNLSLRLRPQVLDDLGLVVAIRWLIDQFRKRLTRARVSLDIPQKLDLLPGSNAAITLYRVAQEALTNVAKHSEATLVRVKIRARDGHLQLTILDNGKGFHPDTARKGFSTGLSGMAERVNLLGGEFQIRSKPGHGAAIRCSIPKDPIKK